MMCPQLFINYKLKSVAHLPWRQMTYKFLHTIVDDLFAFVIKMPTLHRLSVFRDGTIPWLRFRDRESYARNKTKEYDALAMRYFSYALYPLVAGYAVYSLIYETHKSWYSWVLNSLTGCVYTFGFIMMCPQLFINYKLKSVAHLPWRQMTYKFLNTIVDDLFAFVIKMPTLHRLSVFRD
ncbi:unnamed protein product, partial [Closterium sp. NIES-54]